MLLETPRRRSAATLTALLAVASLVLAGCGSSTKEANGGAGSGPCGTKDKTTLTVGLFGSFGFEENGLWDAYHKRCPNITIKQDVVEQSADYWTRLKTRLASGSGLSDVQAIEIGFVADVVQNCSLHRRASPSGSVDAVLTSRTAPAWGRSRLLRVLAPRARRRAPR